MLLRTHLVFAVFVYLLLYNIVGQKVLFLVGLIVATGFVDIDSRKSKVGRKWFFRPLQWFVKHRGIFHSLIFGILLSGLIYYFVNTGLGLGFALGYGLHLFLDLMTRSGVKLFWPFDFRIGLGLKSGGLVEEVLFVLVLLVDVWLGIKMIS